MSRTRALAIPTEKNLGVAAADPSEARFAGRIIPIPGEGRLPPKLPEPGETRSNVRDIEDRRHMAQRHAGVRV